ncbi:MAG: hypothetical protein QNK04_26715 [Myxococcota bacterium]|nr:hypothetical protein [Myxococcota bacterium]
MESWQQTVERIADALTPAGLDVVWPFPSRLVAEVSGRPAPRDRLGLLIGNTRALWSPFTAAFARDAELHGHPDPVDRYCEREIERGLSLAGGGRELFWAHTLTPEAFPIQALAHTAGLCDVAPCRLAIHERYGPWLALRAVAVMIDEPGPSEVVPPPTVCAPCPAPCREPFAAAQAAGQELETHWRLWLAVRDACPVGRAHRYPARQLEYHYTKQRSLLS